MATDHTAFVLRDGEFWLPTQFLSDDEPGIQPPVPSCGATCGRFFPPVDSGNGCGHSTLTSPGDSVVGSADVSDNEEDFISDLTWKVAQSTLEDDFAPLHSKGLFPSGSPKSTLCGACGCGRVPGRGSPNGLPQMKPVQPPTLDVLYHAAGKVANMRRCQEQQQMDHDRHLQQRLHHLIRMHNLKASILHYPNQAPSHLSALQLSYLLGGNGSKDAKAVTGMSPAWPTLQQAQQPRLFLGNANSNGGSAAMRAVFLGSSNGARRGSTGTGVFLPWRAGVDPEPKRKQGCSTVLIPAKVVQALNLNLGEMNTPASLSSSLNVRPESHFDGGRRIRSGYYQPGHQQQQQRAANVHVQTAAIVHVQTAANVHVQTAVHPEISLPSEWTY